MALGGKPVSGAAVLASAARTTDPAYPEIQNDFGASLIVVIDVTAVSGASSVVFTIQGQDPASGNWYNILASAAKTTVATTVLRVSQNIAASANLIAQDIVPERLRIKAVHGTSDSTTYSVGVILAQ